MVAAALLLAGCGTAGSSTSAASSPAGSPRASASSLDGHDTGLELRKVLDAQPASAGQCPVSSSASPSTDAAPTASPVTACAADGTIVYTLGPAVVTGTQWDSMRLDQSTTTGSWRVLALLDPSGSSALTQATGELATEDEPRNQIAFYAHGAVAMAPTVQQPIYGGQVIIADGLEQADAQQLLDDLTG